MCIKGCGILSRSKTYVPGSFKKTLFINEILLIELLFTTV